jgi:predicted kinase
MNKVNLVLLTGLPASGKSVAAERLVNNYGFAVLSTDNLRNSLFREDYGELRKNGKVREEITRKVIDYSKEQILLEGINLVIDSCSPTDKFRKRMLGLSYNLEQSVQKSILYVKTDFPTIYSRQSARGRTNEAIETILGYWNEPQQGFMGSNLCEIKNNNSDINEFYDKIGSFYEFLKN